MNELDEKMLRRLLSELISMQDDITHLNEQGSKYQIEVVGLVEKRKKLVDNIVELVSMF